MAGLLFLAVDGHHLVIQAVSESYTVVPVLGFHMTGALMQNIVGLTREMFVISIKNFQHPSLLPSCLPTSGSGSLPEPSPRSTSSSSGLLPSRSPIGLLGIGLTAPVFLDVATGLSQVCPGRSACC